MQHPNSQRTNSFQQPQSSRAQYQLRHPQNIQQVLAPVQQVVQSQESNLYLNSGLQNEEQRNHDPQLLHAQSPASHQIQPVQDIEQFPQQQQIQYQRLQSNGLFVNEQQSILLQEPPTGRPIFQNVSVTGAQQPLHNLQYSQQYARPQHVLQAQHSHYSDSAQYSQNAHIFNNPPYAQYPNHPAPSNFSHHNNLQQQHQSNYRRLTQPSHPPQSLTAPHIQHNRRNHSHHCEEIQQSLNNGIQHTGFINSSHPYSINGLVTNNRSVSDIPSSFQTNPEHSSLYFTPAAVSSSQQPPNKAEEVDLQSPSVSTSPSISFHNDSIHHQQQEPVAPQSGGKFRSVINRIFGPQRGVRDSSGQFENADVDHISVSASSHQSSTDLHAKNHPFNNGLRRFDRKQYQTERSHGRDIHDPHKNEFASFPPPNPSSIHHAHNRSTSSLRITQPMHQTTNVRSINGTNHSPTQGLQYGWHQQPQSTSYVQKSSINSPPLNPTNNQNRSLSNVSVPTNGKATQAFQSMAINSHPIGFPKKFSDRPPSQTGPSIIKVVPTKRKPSPYIQTENPQQIQSTNHATNHALQTGSSHKTNSNTTSARSKPPRQPSLRPTAQPIRKQPPSSSRVQRSFSSTSQVLPPVFNDSNLSQVPFRNPGAQVDEPSTLQLHRRTPSNHENIFSERNSHQIPTMKSNILVSSMGSNVNQTNMSLNRSNQNSQLRTRKVNSDQASITSSLNVENGSNMENIMESENGAPISNVAPYFQSMQQREEIIYPSTGKQNFETENQNLSTLNTEKGPSSIQTVHENSNLTQRPVRNNSKHKKLYNDRSQSNVSSIKSPNNSTVQSRREINLQNHNRPVTRLNGTENEALGNNLDRTSIPQVDISYKPTTRSDGPPVQNQRKSSSSKTASIPNKNKISASSRPSGSIFRDPTQLVQRRINSSIQSSSIPKPVQPVPEIQSSLTRHQYQRLSSHRKKLPPSSASSENGKVKERKVPKQLQSHENSTKIIPRTSIISNNNEPLSTTNRNSHIQTWMSRNPNHLPSSNGIHSSEGSYIGGGVPSRIPSPTTSSKIKPKHTTVPSTMISNQATQLLQHTINSAPKISTSSSASTPSTSSLPDQYYQNEDFPSLQNIPLPETNANRPIEPSRTTSNTTSAEPKHLLFEMGNPTSKNSSITPKKPISLNSHASSSRLLFSRRSMQQPENIQGKSLIYSQQPPVSSAGSSTSILSLIPMNSSASDPSVKSENDLTSAKSQDQIQFEEQMPITTENDRSVSPLEKNNSSQKNRIFQKSTIISFTENIPSKSRVSQPLQTSASPSTLTGISSLDTSKVELQFEKSSGYNDDDYVEEEGNGQIENGCNNDISERRDRKNGITYFHNSDQIFPDKNVITREESKNAKRALSDGSELTSRIPIRRLAGPMSKTIPDIQNDLHPDVKAACSSVERNGTPKPLKIPLHTPPVISETTDFPVIEHSTESTEIDSSESISAETSENATSNERNTHFTSTGDSKEFETSINSMRTSFNDEFETDLNESKLSTSICYSKEDHSEIKKIPSVEWTVQNCRSEYEILSFSSFSRSQNSSNFSSVSPPAGNLENGTGSSDFSPLWSSLQYNSSQLQRKSILPPVTFLPEDSFSSSQINHSRSMNEYSSVMRRINNYEKMRQQLRSKKKF